MRIVSALAVVVFALALTGCGDDKDLNKDIKPVGKDAPRPESVGANKDAPAAKAPPVIR